MGVACYTSRIIQPTVLEKIRSPQDAMQLDPYSESYTHQDHMWLSRGKVSRDKGVSPKTNVPSSAFQEDALPHMHPGENFPIQNGNSRERLPS